MLGFFLAYIHGPLFPHGQAPSPLRPLIVGNIAAECADDFEENLESMQAK